MIQEIVLGISLLVFMASFISSPRLRNAQSYKLLGFLGDFASQGLIIFRYNWKDSWQLEETVDVWKRQMTIGRDF